MKITKLVLQFNRSKIAAGLTLSVACLILSTYLASWIAFGLLIFAFLIVLNICLAIYASYELYDKSNLYAPKKLFKPLGLKKTDQTIFLHASFDPVSRELENIISEENLKVYNLYGNRHEDEDSIKLSNKVFPPNPREVTVDPTNLPDQTNTVDYILAVTSLHEILSQEKRIQFFKEANRVMKEGGTLVICEQMKDWTNFLFFNIGVFHFVSFKQWQEAITQAGLKIEKVEKITPWGTMMLVKK